MTADLAIASYKQSSIRRVFPGQYYESTIEDIEGARNQETRRLNRAEAPVRQAIRQVSDRQRWFSARLLFESNPALFEERLILLRSAAGLDDAEKRAKALGKRDQQDYKNLAGQEIVWGFTEVLDVVELDSPVIDEGSEVYCHFLFPFEVEEIKASLKPGSLG